jgi:hypothetical protein
MFGLSNKTGKQKAHQLLYDLSMKAYSSNKPLHELLEENPEITDKLSPHELSELLKPANHIGVAAKLTELTITSAEEWLATSRPGGFSENTCPLANKNGECTIRMETD